MQPREQLIVAAGALVAALVLIYLVLWEPFALARDHRAGGSGIGALAGGAYRADRRPGAGGGLPACPASASDVFPAVGGGSGQQGRRTINKPLSRINPDGDKQVRVWIDDVSFDALLRWMYHDLQSRYGVRIDNIAVERRSTAGVVNARLTLVRAQ